MDEVEMECLIHDLETFRDEVMECGGACDECATMKCAVTKTIEMISREKEKYVAEKLEDLYFSLAWFVGIDHTDEDRQKIYDVIRLVNEKNGKDVVEW